MSKKQNSMITGLLTAIGAVGAFFGVRALMNRMRGDAGGRSFSYRERQAIEAEDVTSDIGRTSTMASRMAADEGDRAATGVPMVTDRAAGVNPSEDVSAAPAVNTSASTNMPWNETSSMHMSEQQARTQPAMPSGDQTPDMPTAGVTTTGRTQVGENYSTQLESQGERDEVGIPATGMDAPVADMPRTQDRTRDMDQRNMNQQTMAGNMNQQNMAGSGQVQTDQPVMVGSLVGPLIVHLLSFHNMMKLLQTRRDTVDAADSNPNTPDVRAGGADAVGSLLAQVPEFDHAALVPGSLQERIVQMMERIREMLQNTDHSEDDLFRYSDEMRPAVCKILDQIHQAQEDNVTGFDEVEKAYGCH